MKWSAPLVAFSLLVLNGCQRAPAQTTKPAPGVERVLIVSVDGMRPDVMLRAKTPNLRGLCDRGSFTFWAYTTDVAITLPSHVSMLTGAIPEKHGITWNEAYPGYYPQVPTLFEVAKAAGLSTGMVAAKRKFCVFERPGAIDWSDVLDEDENTDADVGREAARVLVERKPRVMFVHFREVDGAGHWYGWGGAKQLQAIERVDEALGTVLRALDEAKLTDSTAIIVSADHGGAGYGHGGTDPRSRHIPWIAAGPGIRKDYDLTQAPSLRVNTYDTFATACWLMGLAYREGLDCKPIREVLEPPPEMLHTARGGAGKFE